MNKRVFYLLATIVLIAVEVLIALFVHDNFLRPYILDAQSKAFYVGDAEHDMYIGEVVEIL